MSVLDPLLDSALKSHRDGRLEQACAQYRQILAAQPGRADVLNLLGMTLRQQERFAEALAPMRQAIAIDPTQAAYFGNLAEAHRGLGQIPQAVECYAQAARLAPKIAEIHSNLGILLAQVGRIDEADASYARAIAANPQYPEAHYHRGNLFQVGRRWDQAIECYRRALAIRPDYLEAQCNLGNALRERGDLAEALRWLQSAVALRGDFVPAVTNLAVVLEDLGRLDEALQYCQRALQLAPERPQTHLNLATVLKDLGDPAAAIPHYDRALAIQGDYAQAHCSRGTALLALGQFAAGWAGYEHRVRCEQFDTRDFPQPRWDGSALAGRTLLVHAEQGLGDTLHFIRYWPLVDRQGPQVIVAAQQALVPLLAASGVTNLVAIEQPLPPFDVHAPLLSLPYIFGTRLDSVPHDVPYLAAEPNRVEKWREHLRQYSGMKVGIVWQGRRQFRADHLRSIPLAAFAALARLPGVRLFSLQKGPGAEQLENAEAAPLGVVDLAGALDNEGGAFMDTAAAMKSLDLVVTSDTAAAHLAGALAVPVWVALSAVPEWRWMLGRQDSPWYPTMRLFRQTKLGQWSDVFARMAAELQTRL
jgi:tetratricopeptide (TPR) repeat protein